MNDIIYINDKNEVVDKDRATRFEQYIRDDKGNVIQRIYGYIGKKPEYQRPDVFVVATKNKKGVK
jgi:hypothetical protein